MFMCYLLFTSSQVSCFEKKKCKTSIFEAKDPLKGKMNAKSIKTELLAGDRDLGMGTVLWLYQTWKLHLYL